MYLSKLEIVGFKSFADKITLSFQDGLCAIVGPNGVGKTNFVDAIRWVLGEQKTSVLRSETMENVIFNGSKNRKQLGMAEVSITIINNKKILPSEFDEINIARRLYRDGDSQYLINKQNARLKDIQNLFMDSGLGADSYSVIELKMIENLLNGNVLERREIFEEAAGIKKFKQNKKEASKKLQVVSLDIDRINDILQEVQKNVNSLSRQASKTKRYNNLINELRQLELNYSAFELLNNKSKLDIFENQYIVLNQNLSKLEKEISEIEKFQAEIKLNFKKTDEQYQSLIKQEIEVNAQLSDANNSIKINEEKIRNIENFQNSLSKEIEDSKNYISKNTQNIENLRVEYQNLLKNQADLENKLNHEKDKESNINSEFIVVQKNLTAKQNTIGELKNRKNYLLSIIQKNKSSIEKIQKRIEEENQKILRYNQQIEELNQLIENHKIQRNHLSEKATILRTKLKELQLAKTESEKIIENSREEELNLKKKLNEKQVEKKFLESIVVTDESIKTLLSNDEWIDGKERIMFGEIIIIDEKYKHPALVALEDAISAIIVNDLSDIESGIQILRDKKKGLANFVFKQNDDKVVIDKSIINENGVLGYLSDFIDIKEEFGDYLKQIAQDILIVEDVNVAIDVITKYKLEKVVTLDGVVFNKNGIIRGGSESFSQKEAIIGRKNKINRLSKEIDELERKIVGLQEIIKQEQSKIWNYAIPDLENELKNIEKQINLVENDINSQINRIEIIKNSNQNSNATLNQLINESQEISQEKTEFSEEIDSIDSGLEVLESEFELIQNEYNTLKYKLDKQIKEIRILEIDLAKNTETLKHINSEIEKLTALTENAKKRMQSKQEELRSNAETKKVLQNQMIESFEQRNQLQLILDELQQNKQVFELQRKKHQEQINQYDITLNQYRKNYQKLQTDLHQIDIEKAAIHTKIQTIQQLVQEQYQIDIQEYIQQNQLTTDQVNHFDFETSKNEIIQIKEKIAALGNINFQALEDFEEQKKRLDFLLTQMNDLENSKKTLTDTIDEINKIAVEKFTTTFEQIRQNFKHLFKLLFGEDGEADITLEGQNVLEAGIYISAKPPFKKPSSIDLLSAGEKTLTAIALLFAIYLVKPSPFCILDEVDAPLDDNNIDKFVNLIKKFSKEKDIQFILITHNKRTMEAADVLYGLTMEEEGVTKVVSVKLEK